MSNRRKNSRFPPDFRKTVVAVGVILGALLAHGCRAGRVIDSSESTVIGGGLDNERRLLVLLYMNADNELESQAIRSLNQLETVELEGTGVDVLALVDRSPGYDTSNEDWTDTRLLEIAFDPNGMDTRLVSSRIACDELGIGDGEVELDLGDPSVLGSFLEFAAGHYPADLTLLILWGHGSGWRSAVESPGGKDLFAVGIDDSSSSDPLFTAEVASALSGRKVDLIGFDCCSEALIEVAYALRESAAYLIASEGLVQLDGWDYADLLPRLCTVGHDAAAVVGSIVDSFAAVQATSAGATISALDLSGIGEVADRLNRFSDAAYAWIDSEERRTLLRSLLFREVEAFYSVPGDLNIDLVDLCRKVCDRIEGLDDVAVELEDSVLAAVVDEWHHPEGHAAAHGLAIHYVPLDSDGTAAAHDTAYFRGYPSEQPLRFVDDSSWVPQYPSGPGLLYRLWYEAF